MVTEHTIKVPTHCETDDVCLLCYRILIDFNNLLGPVYSIGYNMAKVSTTTLSESAGCRVEVGHAHFLIVSRAATVATRGKEKEVGKGEK